MTDVQEIQKPIASDLGTRDETTPQQSEIIANPPAVALEQSAPNNLKNILLSQEKLTDIKKDLGAMIDVMAQNPSLFSRAANYWGEIPLWQKIIGGILLIVPTLVIAFFTHAAIFLALSAFSLVAYVASSLILDNHYSSITSTTENLKEGINGLADVLGIVIQSLDTLHKELSRSLEEFQKENEKLAAKVIELGSSVEELTRQTNEFRLTVEALQETKNQLEQSTATLDSTVKDHAQLIERISIQLEQTQKKYENSQLELTKKVEEFNKVKTDLSLELIKTKSVAETLKAAVNQLSDSAITNEENREAFNKRVETFLGDKEASFTEVAGLITDSEKRLRLVEEELTKTTQQLKESLERNEKLITRLEALEQSKIARNTKSKQAGILDSLGVFATKTPDQNPSEARQTNQPH